MLTRKSTKIGFARKLVSIQQRQGTATGAKMVVPFVNISTGGIEKQNLNESAHKLLAWKCSVDDIISLWHIQYLYVRE